MHCSAAAWAPYMAGRHTVLLRTALGILSCFLSMKTAAILQLSAYGKFQEVRRDGVRLERVDEKLVSIVATRSELSAFYEKEKLEDLIAVQGALDGSPTLSCKSAFRLGGRSSGTLTALVTV